MKNLYFYSTNSYLAYLINRQFYNDQHFVWCSPVFDPTKLGDDHPWKNIGVTSNPYKIYINLREAIATRDSHYSRISEIRKGIKLGASIKLKSDSISEIEFGIINQMVDKSDFNDLRPMMYIINYQMVKDRIVQVPVENRANPLGIEYQIIDLNGFEFEQISF